MPDLVVPPLTTFSRAVAAMFANPLAEIEFGIAQ